VFYNTKENDHGLPYNPVKAIVAPRPIGWISSKSRCGRVNLAPYSLFNLVSSKPPMVMFCSEDWKDTIAFISETREFVCNLVSYAQAVAMNDTSSPLPRGENEFEHAGLGMSQSNLVDVPRVTGAPASLECRLIKIEQLVSLDGELLNSWQVIGGVVGVHIEDAYIENGRFNSAKARPVARAGYMDFVDASFFEIPRPKGGGNPTGT